MAALHLYPIHNALAIRFQSLGWDGNYAIQCMVLENGRWLAVGDPALFPRESLESPNEGDKLTSGAFELIYLKKEWIVRHRGGQFGKCKAHAMERALEGARVEATGHRDGVVPDGEPTSTLRQIPINVEPESEPGMSASFRDRIRKF